MSISKNKMNNQHGLSMIESLIALVVISIGLLGIASLQLTSMQQSASANWHSLAVWYSYEMTDRIAANTADPTNPVNFNLYDGVDTENDYDSDCKNNDCNPSEIRDADAQEWSSMMDTLPGGRGVIRSNGLANVLTVSVMWEDNSGETNCTNGEPATATQSCFTVTVTP